MATLVVAAAEEPSGLPFQLADGALVAWAALVSSIALSRPDAPAVPVVSRAVMVITVTLASAVLAMTIVAS